MSPILRMFCAISFRKMEDLSSSSTTWSTYWRNMPLSGSNWIVRTRCTTDSIPGMMDKAGCEKKLQEAIEYAQPEPDIPRARISTLYEVNGCTLRRRLAGISLKPYTCTRNRSIHGQGTGDHAKKFTNLTRPPRLIYNLTYDLLSIPSYHWGSFGWPIHTTSIGV